MFKNISKIKNFVSLQEMIKPTREYKQYKKKVIQDEVSKIEKAIEVLSMQREVEINALMKRRSLLLGERTSIFAR